MSSKHRHGLPRKRPVNKGRDEIEDQLPAPEPVAEGAPAAVSAAADDGPVRVRCADSEEYGLDVVLTVEVPAMDKKAVADAVSGPLRNAAERHGAALRFRRVVVDFQGEALIGSAIKELVAERLAPARPCKVVVRRGFGNEIVHEGPAPKLEVERKVEGGATTVTIGTGDLDAADLPQLLAPVLADIAAGAAGAKLTLQFTGSAKPDRELRDHIAATLQQAGAVRAAVGARVLFDRELTDRCQVAADGDPVVVTIDPAADPAVTGEAMETVLPDHALGFAGKAITVKWTKAPNSGEGDHFLRLVTDFAPERVEFVVAGVTEVVWPAVLEAVAGKAETVLRVRPNGRDRSTVLKLLPREIAGLEGELRGKTVTVDWPKLFVIDDDTERCLVDAMTGVGAARVACTIAGDDREPFLPPPVALRDQGERCVIAIDTDAGKPAELVRALERAAPRFGDHLRGKTVRILVAGSAPASRTLLRTALDHAAGGGPTRLEVEDHGAVDVLLPPMLSVTRTNETAARIAVDLGGRDAEQQALALKREFEAAALPKGAVVTLVSSPLDDALLAALIEHHAESVTRDDGTQLYPEPLPEPEPEPEPEVLPEPEPETLPAPEAEAPAAPAAAAPPPLPAAAPAAAPAVAATGAIRVLSLNNESVPPTVMIGVAASTDPAHLAAIEQELQGHLPRFQRRAVMVVLEQGGQDVPVRKPDAMVEMLRRVLAAGAAATLVFRGPDAQGRPHFQVLHSTLRAMPVGATFLDPRQRG